MSRVVALAGVLAAFGPACVLSAAGGDRNDDVVAPGVDATVDDGVDAAIEPEPLGNFGEPTLLDAISDPTLSEDDPSATTDLLEIYFDREGDIFTATRQSASEPFGPPIVVVELSTADTESGPEVSGDGLTMYFAREPAGANFDVFVANRASRGEPWTNIRELSEVNSDLSEFPSGTADGGRVLALNRNNDPDGAGGDDLYLATRESPLAAFTVPVNVSELNTAADERNPFITEDGLELWFEVDGTIVFATRADLASPFNPPTPVDVINQDGASDIDPWLSPDQRTLFFASNRTGNQELYQATR